MSLHRGKIDHSDQYQSVKPLAALQTKRRHHEFPAMSVISIFRMELGLGSICYRRLIFHLWPRGDKGAEGGRIGRERWDDDMALQGSRGQHRECGVEQKRLVMDVSKGEKRREKFWV